MADVPGPDDPRYWERLRRGPPLDESESMPTADDHRRSAAKGIRDDRRTEVIVLLVVLGLMLALILPAVLSDSDPAADLPACADGLGYPCVVFAADGDRTVLVRDPATGGIDRLTPDEFAEERDAAYDLGPICQEERGAFPC